MYKIVHNGMYEYIIIKICSKYDISTDTAAFPIMHRVLFTANEPNNAPNSSRQVGVEVASTCNVCLVACFPTSRWSCLPCPLVISNSLGAKLGCHICHVENNNALKN